MVDIKKECNGNCPTCRAIRASRKKDRGGILVAVLLTACVSLAAAMMYLGMLSVQP